MRIVFTRTLGAALLLALAAGARARPVAVETLSGLAAKADLLVVCEVVKIEDGRTEKSEHWNTEITTRRATLRVIRGIQTSDGSGVNAEEITVDYPSIKPSAMPPDGPMFPVLWQDEIALFPLMRVQGGWRFVSEEDAAMIIPAARRPIAAQPATARDFLLQELAAALTNGDYQTMGLAGKYLGDVGTEAPLPARVAELRGEPAQVLPPVVDSVFALVRGEIGESNLRLDQRWLLMGVAAYNAATLPRPALGDLLADDAPVPAPYQLARLAFRKAGPRDLDQRIIRLLVIHQEDAGAAENTVASIAINYANNPDLIAQERLAIADAKPGAMAVADFLVKDATSPLAAKAGIAAREVLDEKAKPYPQEVDPVTARHAVALLLRVGSDDDFAFFLDQVARAKAAATPRYQQYLQAAQDEPTLGASRLIAISRLYIDDSSAVAGTVDPKSWRVCDVAAVLVGRAAEADFGVKPGAMLELRDAGVKRARAYLKSKE